MGERRDKKPTTQPANPLERVTSRDVAKLAPAGVFGYAAGKSIIAKKLIKLFPAHKTYVEPFCGSAAMYFTKSAEPTEVLNDRNEEVIDALRAIQTITPAELDRLTQKDWIGNEKTFKALRASDPKTKVDQLYKFLYVQNFSYGLNRRMFNTARAGASAGSAARVGKFQPRMKDTIIRAGDYSGVMKDYDNADAFYFIDPPYGGYNRSDGIGESEFDEAKFRKTLEGIEGRFLVTYGTKGKLDTSGFEVKRMRQPRTIRSMAGVGGDQFLTHLLIANYKVQAKSFEGLEIDDVMGIVDVDDGGERIMVTGSRKSVSVPKQLGPRAYKNADPYLAYPETNDPIPGVVEVRLVGKRTEVDFRATVDGHDIGWTFDASRADTVRDPLIVAKSFSSVGSRFFFPMDHVPTCKAEIPDPAAGIKIDRPGVELGIQTDTHHEYFLSKGDELTGILKVDLNEYGVDAKHQWLASFWDRFPQALSDFTVLKSGSPMPPPGVSALPRSLEAVVPVEMRFWEMRGDEAIKARDALAVSKLLASENIALVDGEFARISRGMFIEDAAPVWKADGEWILNSLSEIAPEGMAIAEVFELANRDVMAKVEEMRETVLFWDAGDAYEGTIEVLAKSLLSRDGHYIISALDSADARAALSKHGDVFRFRPGENVPVDSVDRIFVATFPVYKDVDRVEPLRKGEWSTATVNDFPDSSFLYVEPGGEKDEEGKTKPRSLRHFPVKDKNGKPDGAHVRNALARIPQSDVPAAAKEKARAAAQRMLEELNKAVFDTPVGPKEREEQDEHYRPRAYSPSDDRPDLGKVETKKILDQDSSGKWHVWSEDHSKHLGGPYDTKGEAVERLREVEGHKEKADFNNPQLQEPGHAPDKTKKDDMTMNPGEPGSLQPAQGNPYRRHKKRYEIVEMFDMASSLLFKASGEEQIVYGIVLEPDTVDAQNDVYSADEVRTAAYKYMEDFQNTGLMHQKQINDRAKLVENYIAPCDFEMGGQKVKKGTWVMATHVLDAALWKDIKSGALTGYSIGGSAQRTPEKTSKGMRKTDHQGIPITIDRPKGYVQSGTDAEGKKWEREYKVDYGYIPKTRGGDGEGVDVFMGPDPDAPMAYWFVQHKGDGKTFDEYKVVVGCANEEDAKKIYKDHIPEKYMGECFPMGIEQMKALLNKEPEHKMQPEGPP